jgi:hypothetical protein
MRSIDPFDRPVEKTPPTIKRDRDQRPRTATAAAAIVAAFGAFHIVFGLLALAHVAISIRGFSSGPYWLFSPNFGTSAFIDFVLAALCACVVLGLLTARTSMYFLAWAMDLMTLLIWLFSIIFIEIAVPYILLDLITLGLLIASFDYFTQQIDL